MSKAYNHYLTTEETAQALGVSKRTVARYKATHKITPIRVNNKDMYPPDEVTRFSATSETEVDKLRKQHLFNSARLVELEARVSYLESLLGTRSKVEKLNIGEVDVPGIANTLHYLCNLGLNRWTIQTVEDLNADIAKMSDRLIKKLGPCCKTALEIGYLHAKSSEAPRARIAEAISKLTLDRVTSLLG